MSQDSTATKRPSEGSRGTDRTVASGWLPDVIVADWPSLDTHQLIVERRRTLYEAMQDLEAASARASGQSDWMDHIEAALSTLSAALDRHVAEIESPDGLFDEVLDRAPWLRPAVDALRADHEELRQDCRSAMEVARSRPETDAKEMRRMIMIILGRLAVHRQDGAELLFDAHNVDVAAGD